MAKSRDAMVASAKKLCGFENSDFVPDADWAEWIERGVEDLWEKLVEARGVDVWLKPTTIQLVQNDDLYDLPADFFQLKTIFVTRGSNNYVVDKFEWADEANLRNAQFPNRRIRYRLVGSETQAGTTQIMFLPPPQEPDVVTVRYVYKPVFAAGTDTIDGINGWEEYAELLAAIKALNKEESDPSMLAADLNRVERRIEKLKASRDKGRPSKIQEVRKDRWRRWRGRLIDELV